MCPVEDQLRKTREQDEPHHCYLMMMTMMIMMMMMVTMMMKMMTITAMCSDCQNVYKFMCTKNVKLLL